MLGYVVLAQRFYGFNYRALSSLRAPCKQNRRDEHLIRTFAHAVGVNVSWFALSTVRNVIIDREKCHRAFS